MQLILVCQWYFNGKCNCRQDYVHHQKFCFVCLFVFSGYKSATGGARLVVGCDITDQGPVNATQTLLRLRRGFYSGHNFFPARGWNLVSWGFDSSGLFEPDTRFPEGSGGCSSSCTSWESAPINQLKSVILGCTKKIYFASEGFYKLYRCVTLRPETLEPGEEIQETTDGGSTYGWITAMLELVHCAAYSGLV